MAFTVKSTRHAAPVRILVYGDGGVGKSTLGASAPGAIFIAPEDGLVNLDARAVEPSPATWQEALDALEFVGALDDVQTLVVDSLDWLEPLCWAHVCKAGGKKDIEAFGYGKGYVAALDQWRVFLHRCSGLRAKGKNIVFIAHAIAKTFQNPEGDDFSRWQIKLHEKAAGLVKEWVDIVGFAQKEFSTVEQDNKRSKAIGTGRRILRTDGTAAFDAKTRYAMPKSIPLSWESLTSAIRNGDVAAVAALRADLESRVKELGAPDVEEKIRKFLKSNGETTATLTEAVERLDVTLAERRKAS